MAVRLGAVAGRLQARLDGLKSRTAQARAKALEDQRWHYEIEWSRARGAANTDICALELLVLGSIPNSLSRCGHRIVQSSDDKCLQVASQWHAILMTTSLLGRSGSGAVVHELRAVDSALHLLRAQAAHMAPPPVWLCTVRTQPVTTRVSECAHASLWGVARACRQEITTLPAWCVDVNEGVHGLTAMIREHAVRLPTGSVRGMKVKASTEPEVACTASDWFVPRLVAPFSMQDSILDLAFEATHRLLDAHTSCCMASLDMGRLESAHRLLESLCLQFMREAAHSVHDSQVPLWHHKLLCAWGAAQQLPSNLDCVIAPPDVLEAHSDLWVEARLAEQCGPRLVEVLSSSLPYQELLFPNGSMEIVRPVYEDSVVSAFYNRCVMAAVDAIVSLLAKKRLALVLELGAGTGGTASSVLPALVSTCERYVFTDVSEVFLRQARLRFAVQFPFLDYALLNIDADPALQGFRSHTFDVLLATNVLHATPLIRNTLNHCSQLLTPAGTLVVNETLQTSALAQISFGLTDGWWLFSQSCDPERVGQSSPLLSWRQWQALLVDSGFCHSHCMRGDAFLRRQAVIVAHTSNLSRVAAPRPLAKGVHLLSGGLGGLGLLMARLLIEVGASQLVLLSRSDRVVAGSEDDWAWLAKSSGDLQRSRCDISDDADVRSVVRGLCGNSVQLAGVFHAAHQLADSTLAKQHALNFRAAQGPKVHGAAALHAVSCRTPLDLFNACSSVAGLIGSAGQAPHSAANAWMDAMVGWRLGRGVPSQSISWGAVADIGYAARKGADRRAESSGAGSVSRVIAHTDSMYSCVIWN